MADPTLAHALEQGMWVRGKPDAGPYDRWFRGIVVAVEPHIEGQARNVIADGFYSEMAARQEIRGQPAYVVFTGEELMAEERTIIIAQIRSVLPVPYAASDASDCDDCGAPVWLSRASQADAGPDILPLCLRCWKRRNELALRHEAPFEIIRQPETAKALNASIRALEERRN